ncbi:hypothetical protein GNF80_10900 [Clostridium perfringens]|nr:hypothetical protein [Clostridium perfringens]
MDVRIYKIDTGLTGKNFSSDKRTNFPIGGKTNSFYSIGNLMRGLEDYFLQGNLYFIDKEEELEKFENPLGDRWIAKRKYYINHPKKSRENYLIEANKFQEYIFREQLEEVANYLYYKLHINSLKIEVEEGNDFSSYTNLHIEEMKLNGEGKAELKDNKTLEIKWNRDINDYSVASIQESKLNLNNEVKGDKALESKLNKEGKYENLEEIKEAKKQVDFNIEEVKVNEKEIEGNSGNENLNSQNEYLWIGDFKGLVDMVNEFITSNRNDLTYNLEIDNSFEMSEKIAKKIGVNPTWLKKCCFKLTY